MKYPPPPSSHSKLSHYRLCVSINSCTIVWNNESGLKFSSYLQSTDWSTEPSSYFIPQRPLWQSPLHFTTRPLMQWTAVGQLDCTIHTEDDRRCYSSQRDMLCLHLKSYKGKLLGFQVLWRANFREGRGKKWDHRSLWASIDFGAGFMFPFKQIAYSRKPSTPSQTDTKTS